MFTEYIIVDNPNVPPELKPTVSFGEKINVFSGKSLPKDDPAADVELNDIYMQHATVRTMTGQFKKNAVFVNQSNQGADLFSSCFFVDGHMTTTLAGSGRGIVMTKGQHTMKYDPMNEYRHWCPKNRSFDIAHVTIEPEFLFSLLPDDESWSVDLKERLLRRQPFLADAPPAISAAQQRALENILNCPLTGKLGQLMIDTSLIQLMLLNVQAQFLQCSEKKEEKYMRRDRDMIEAVREYLSQSFLEDHTIASLAKRFGTNSTKLMSLFKKIFNISIFEHIADLKMQHAKVLLMDEGYFVADVSREVGYKNPNHFSVAFKKKFGINPSQLKYM